jgi:hypothetical protein
MAMCTLVRYISHHTQTVVGAARVAVSLLNDTIYL